MKKTLNRFLILCAIMLAVCLQTAFAGGETDPIAGDANLDGVVNGLDVIRMMKYLAGEKDADTGLPVAVDPCCADVNADEKVDEKDLLRLIRYMGGEDVTLTIKPKKPVIETMEETVTADMPFNTEYVDDDTRYESDGEIVTRDGVNGVRTKIYSVTYIDGKETSRTLLSDVVTKEPVSKIISRGTKKNDTTTKTVTVTEEIPYEEEIEEFPTLEIGTRISAHNGVNGKKEVTYSVTYNSAGEEILKEKISETITVQPQNETIAVGTGIATYDYEYADIDLSPYMKGTRSAELDEKCKAQAMKMAKKGKVEHSPGNMRTESVGADSYINIRHLAYHGGEALIWREYWGAGCVKQIKHKPNGTDNIIYYMCAQASGGIVPEYYEKGNPGYDQITH